MEIVDLGIEDFDPPMNIRFADDRAPSPRSSANFGMGIEMLMNDSHRGGSAGGSTSVNLGDLDKMDGDLSGMERAGSARRGETKVLSGISEMFGFGAEPTNRFSGVDVPTDSNVGHATAESSAGSTSSWDGYRKAGEAAAPTRGGAGLSDRERRRKKIFMLKSLDAWSDKGLIKYSSRFDAESSYEEVEDEYESAIEDKQKKAAVVMGAQWVRTLAQSIEWTNSKLNPFDIDLDGWGEKVSEDIDSCAYDDIFAELHDKYKGGNLSPELSLLLKLGFSASVIVGMNKMASSMNMPEISNVMRQNPAFMKAFSDAAVQGMSQQSPAFSMANSDPGPNTSYGPPPAPVETQQRSRAVASGSGMMYTQHPGNRPDIVAGRGPMFHEGGVDMHNAHGSYTSPPEYAPRAEMRGPQGNADVNSILSGLKTIPGGRAAAESFRDEGESVVSIGSIRDMNGAAMPKRASRRKPRSDKNVVSLDI